MNRFLQTLTEDFQTVVTTLLQNCLSQGIELKPFYGRRSVYDQAKLWRQSRSTAEIQKATSFLKKQGADYIAQVLQEVGPQHGRWATNTLPGESWHQWGEAVDCFVFDQESGKAIWSAKHEGYRIYADEAKKLNLTAGYYWQSQDAVHVQYRPDKVTKFWSWKEIDQKMKVQFS